MSLLQANIKSKIILDSCIHYMSKSKWKSCVRLSCLQWRIRLILCIVAACYDHQALSLNFSVSKALLVASINIMLLGYTCVYCLFSEWTYNVPDSIIKLQFYTILRVEILSTFFEQSYYISKYGWHFRFGVVPLKRTETNHF